MSQAIFLCLTLLVEVRQNLISYRFILQEKQDERKLIYY